MTTLRAPHRQVARPVPPPRAAASPAWPGPAVADSARLREDDYDKKVKQAAKEKARRRHTPTPRPQPDLLSVPATPR